MKGDMKMKPISILLICAFTLNVLASPCHDSLFIELQNKPTEEMSETDKYYVNQKQDECNNFNDSIVTAQQDSVERAERDHKWKTKTKPLIITGIVFGVIGTIVLFVVALSSDNMWVEVGGQRID